MFTDTARPVFNILTLNGCNPLKGYCWSQIILFIISITGSLLCFQGILFSYVDRKDPILIGEYLDSTSGLLWIWRSSSKMLSLFMIKHRIKHLFSQMDVLFWQPQESTVCEREYLKVRKGIKRVALMYVILNGLCLTAFAMVPLIKGGQNLIFEIYRPRFLSYEVLYIWQCYLGLANVVGGMFSFDMIMYMTMMHTVAQLKLLNKAILGVFDMKIENKSDFKKFKYLMRKCIEHHDFLLQHIQSINEGYAESLASFFISMFMGNVVEAYRFTTSPDIIATIRSLLYVVCGVLVIFFMCYFVPAQLLQDEASKISRSIYFSKWYEHSSIAKPVVMIIGRTSRLSKIVPCGIWELSLETGLMVIRSTISYAMFLRTADSMAYS